MNLTLGIQMLRNMGPRYASYRIYHELEKRSGRIKKNHPIAPESKSYISLDTWRALPNTFIIEEKELINLNRRNIPELADKAKRILSNEVLFFNNEWKQLGSGYDWITNPETGFTYDVTRHWSEIKDFNSSNGDIKYVWEKSRFTWLLPLIRHEHHYEEDHSEYIFSQIEDWIERNPVNQGPNWKCSQEISLRLFNWCYALAFYRNSKALTPSRWEKIQNTVYWSLHHVFHHINFSRIAVRNNHAITETLCLTLSDILFPFIPETKKWARKGRIWFEKEIKYQVYKDGTFLQFSMNYHRVLVQLLSLGFSVAEKNGKPFSRIVYERAYKSLDFLYQCLQEENGNLPNYGNNDGALFFPLTDQAYRDYRPQLNTLHKFLTGNDLYREENLNEDFFWMAGKNNYSARFPTLQKRIGISSYPIGGFYLLREENTFTFIRCGNHKDRPAQADNLHLDVWKDGVNVLRDSGTYKYNTAPELQKYFFGTASHNTVMLEDNDQMLKGSRFIWFYWTQAKYAGWEEKQDRYIFKGGVSAFRHLNKGIIHHRQMEKLKGESQWIVKDQIDGHSGNYFQQWHLSKEIEGEFAAVTEGVEIENKKIPSLYSSHYAEKEEGNGIAFPFTENIKTTIKFNT